MGWYYVQMWKLQEVEKLIFNFFNSIPDSQVFSYRRQNLWQSFNYVFSSLSVFSTTLILLTLRGKKFPLIIKKLNYLELTCDF